MGGRLSGTPGRAAILNFLEIYRHVKPIRFRGLFF